MESRGRQASKGQARLFDNQGCISGSGSASATGHPPERHRMLAPHPLNARNPKSHSESPSHLPVGGRLIRNGATRLVASTLRPSKLRVRPATQKVLNLPLSNPCHYCYANSLIPAIVWSASCAPEGMWIDHKGLRSFLQWLSSQHKPQLCGAP